MAEVISFAILVIFCALIWMFFKWRIFIVMLKTAVQRHNKIFLIPYNHPSAFRASKSFIYYCRYYKRADKESLRLYQNMRAGFTRKYVIQANTVVLNDYYLNRLKYVESCIEEIDTLLKSGIANESVNRSLAKNLEDLKASQSQLTDYMYDVKVYHDNGHAIMDKIDSIVGLV